MIDRLIVNKRLASQPHRAITTFATRPPPKRPPTSHGNFCNTNCLFFKFSAQNPQ